jgi:hypothetical protein
MPPESSNPPVGPTKVIEAFGKPTPYYLLTFDKKGRCTSPKTADHLIEALRSGALRDVIMYSHGWNNDFPTAMGRYDLFLDRLSAAALAHPATLPAGFSPVFVGIVWPSTALTFGAENAPDIAATVGADGDSIDSVSKQQEERAQLLGSLNSNDRKEAAELLRDEAVSAEAAARLAEIVAPYLDDTSFEVAAPPAAADDLLLAWRSRPATGEPKANGGFGNFGTANAGGQAIETAGLLDNLDPRWIVRVATVLMMKTRAGVVGRGLSEIVGRILGLPATRLFLVGHSYGAKVVMSALAAQAPPRPAEAAMLLQPAVSHLCFAQDIGGGQQGGFRRVLERVRKPIFVTWSKDDVPLHRLFHLAARRKSDVGEVQPLGAPSRFAALGGFGPSGCAQGECEPRTFAAPPTVNEIPGPPARIVAFDGGGVITGHGDVHNNRVIWAMSNLLN